MYRVWFMDLERAVDALIEKVEQNENITLEMFGSIEGNAYGDFVFRIDKNRTYVVKHNDFSVWKQKTDWRDSRDGMWKELK